MWPLGSQHTLSTASPQGAGERTIYLRILERWRRHHSHGDGIYLHDRLHRDVQYRVPAHDLGESCPGRNCCTCIRPFYPVNSVVKLTATANPGYKFASLDWQCSLNVEPGHKDPDDCARKRHGETSPRFRFTPLTPTSTTASELRPIAVSGSNSSCSLRDALAAAAAATSGADITLMRPYSPQASLFRQERLCWATAGAERPCEYAHPRSNDRQRRDADATGHHQRSKPQLLPHFFNGKQHGPVGSA